MCHHPGGSAPFSLLSYGDVKRRAGLILSATERRYMPPWKADPSNGPFVGQQPLTADEIGAAMGEPAPAVAAPGAPAAVPSVFAASAASSEGLPDKVAALERAEILAALRAARGVKARAAKQLGISRPTLDKKMTDLAIDLWNADDQGGGGA